jgi:hypothetical protein
MFFLNVHICHLTEQILRWTIFDECFCGKGGTYTLKKPRVAVHAVMSWECLHPHSPTFSELLLNSEGSSSTWAPLWLQELKCHPSLVLYYKRTQDWNCNVWCLLSIFSVQNNYTYIPRIRSIHVVSIVATIGLNYKQSGSYFRQRKVFYCVMKLGEHSHSA